MGLIISAIGYGRGDLVYYGDGAVCHHVGWPLETRIMVCDIRADCNMFPNFISDYHIRSCKVMHFISEIQ